MRSGANNDNGCSDDGIGAGGLLLGGSIQLPTGSNFFAPLTVDLGYLVEMPPLYFYCYSCKHFFSLSLPGGASGCIPLSLGTDLPRGYHSPVTVIVVARR